MRKRDSRGLMESIEGDIEALADFVDAVATVGEYLLDTDDSERPIERKEHERELIAAGGWQCKCGQVNASYVGSCQCGGTKQKDTVPYKYKEVIETEPEKPAPTRGWVCLCGKKNSKYIPFCSCGGSQLDGMPYKVETPIERPPAPTSGWICLCGKKNSNYNAYCSCGGVKTDGTPYDDGQPSEQPLTEAAPEEMVEKPVAAEEITVPPETAEEMIAVQEPIEEVIEIPEPVKIVLPQMEKPQEKRIEKRTNKRFDNPFREEEKEWKCSRCGAIKPSFMPICECGMSKRDNG